MITGPSGAGKGTLIRRLIDGVPDLALAVSATTRPQRPGEEHGREYWFLGDEEFDREVAAGNFLEWVPYVTARYGTLRRELDRIGDGGDTAVLDPVAKRWLDAPASEPLRNFATVAGTPYGFIVLDAEGGGFILRPAE